VRGTLHKDRLAESPPHPDRIDDAIRPLPASGERQGATAPLRDTLMTQHYDALETCSPAEREADLFTRLPDILRKAVAAPAYAERLKGIDPAAVISRAALARLPVLRKSDLPALHKATPPFGGFVVASPGSFGRLFTSPGPIFEPEPAHPDPWRGARALFAAGFRPGDVVLNTFSYHLTPGGFIFDSSARALGCAVIPAGPGNTEAQFELIEAYRPVGYSGTPDFLKILLDAASGAARDISSIKRALVSGAAFPKSLQDEIKSRGIDAYQAFGTADLGLIAFETSAREGMVVNEGLILEIVQPGTGDPVSDGDVGEIVVTSLDPHHPWIRLALGDLTAALPGPSPCGRTNTRIKGWMGRADQTTKVKGMFVRPEQVAEVGKRHPELGRLRLVVTREAEADVMTLKAEYASPSDALREQVATSLRAVAKLSGAVELVAPGSLPNDGKVISDERKPV
jgi:phenylacetate-CoA ligase